MKFLTLLYLGFAYTLGTIGALLFVSSIAWGIEKLHTAAHDNAERRLLQRWSK